MPPATPLVVAIPDLITRESSRGGHRFSARAGRRRFHAVIRSLAGRLVYETHEGNERGSRGWATVDTRADLARKLATLLAWTAIGGVEEECEKAAKSTASIPFREDT